MSDLTRPRDLEEESRRGLVRKADERGHKNATIGAGVGGAMGGMLGSFCGKEGAAFGALCGAFFGALIGGAQDEEESKK